MFWSFQAGSIALICISPTSYKFKGNINNSSSLETLAYVLQSCIDQVPIAGDIFVVYRDVLPLKRYFLPNFKKRNPTEIRLTVFNTDID